MQSVTVLQFDILPTQHPHTCLSPVSYVPAFPGSHHLSSHEKSCRNLTAAISSLSSSLLPCLFLHPTQRLSKTVSTRENKILPPLCSKLCSGSGEGSGEFTRQQLFHRFLLFKTKKDHSILQLGLEGHHPQRHQLAKTHHPRRYQGRFGSFCLALKFSR